ncbi:HalOD1 output domain-containing protein [Haloprofundus salilacus]|uniref:HalOD1 output domain-containing protein n=1 Tax=Haloprofundus salilacus TaxID=2876190 RepID=UPI001CCDB5A8
MSKTVTEWTTASRPVSVTAVEAVAECRGTSPLELETPLVDIIDADALDDLFDERYHRIGTDGLTLVAFVFCGCEVTVHNDGRVVATLLESSSAVSADDNSKQALRR